MPQNVPKAFSEGGKYLWVLGLIAKKQHLVIYQQGAHSLIDSVAGRNVLKGSSVDKSPQGARYLINLYFFV
jgi:hypothetical protein